MNENDEKPSYSIVTQFMHNYSLNLLYFICKDGSFVEWWDFTRRIIFIYGIAYGLDFLHDNEIIHKNLNFHNILISGKKLPKITDFMISSLFPFKIENIPDDKLIFIAPEVIEKQDYSKQSDIYSFGIIAIMLMANNTKILEEDLPRSDLIEKIKTGLLRTLPECIPSYMHDLLLSLVSKDKNERPTLSKFLSDFESFFQSFIDNESFNFQVFNDYKFLITAAVDKMDEAAKKAKRDADGGDPESMWRFARMRSKGIGCKKNETEAWYYYQKAADNNYKPAQIFIKASKKKNAAIIAATDPNAGQSPAVNKFEKLKEKLRNRKNIITVVSEEKNIINQEQTKFKVDDIDALDENTLLADDPFFDKDSTDMKEIIKHVKIKLLEKGDKFSKTIQDIIKEEKFIITEESRERLLKIIAYIEYGIPVLLEGPTGSSKTFSCEVACKILDALKEENKDDFQNQNDDQNQNDNQNQDPKGKKIVETESNLIRFNLSSETKTKDLIGRYVGNVNSWAGISQENGHFVKAFKKGKILLLDEINLASPSVLQCIEEALDSHILSIEIPGKPLKPIKMHPDFRLIATQNPNKGLFAHKRQDLGLKFYSRFQVITFPEITNEELLQIAQGLAEELGYKDNEVIKQLVQFHSEWTTKEEIQDDPQCFTIREIDATVRAFSNKRNIFDTIMTIYGARYQKKMKDELIAVLLKYPLLIEKEEPFDIPKDFLYCHENKSLKETVKSALFSLENKRNIIIAGKQGSGKTQVALWISNHYNKVMCNKNTDDTDFNEQFYCICTEDTKVADLVGRQSPNGKAEAGDKIINWIPGFLTQALVKGKCCVLESIDEAPATVTERLNGLLDQKNDGRKMFFETPENPEQTRVEIEESFRILATCDIEKIGYISPAFLNRFDVIVLEDQINPESENIDYEELTFQLFNRFSEYAVEKKKKEETTITKQKKATKSDGQNFDIEEIKSVPRIVFRTSRKVSNEVSQIFKRDSNIWNNISKMSKACKAISLLLLEFMEYSKIKEMNIVNYALKLISLNDSLYIVPDNIERQIEQILLSKLDDQGSSTDQEFYYDESPLLRTFMSRLMAYSIVQQPVCVSGPTGAGKTSAARKFARMRPCHNDRKGVFQMHSFHAGTKTSQFYGTATLNNGRIDFVEGTLTIALKNGDVFIADEFNLSPQSIMKSLAPALEQTTETNIYIPGIDQSITISPDFFFIACQNELGTLGRNAIPETISPRFIYIDYPKPSLPELQAICVKISLEEEKDDDIIDTKLKHSSKKPPKQIIPTDVARQLAQYMQDINSLSSAYITQWSLRDIYKIFNRFRFQNREENYNMYIGVDIYHHIYFYTVSAVPKKDQNEAMKQIRNYFQNFSPNIDDKSFVQKYEDCFKELPRIQTHKNHTFLMKGNDFGVNIDDIIDYMKSCSHNFDDDYNSEYSNLHSLWDTALQICLADKREPILLMGNSGFKTFLCKLFIYNADIIPLNQETTVAQLLGSSGFFTSSEAKHFYLKNLCNICIIDESKKLKITAKLKEKWLNDGVLSKNDIQPIVKKGKEQSPKSFKYAIVHLANQLLKNSDDEKCILSNTTLEFRPGLFLNAILQKKSLILKDLANLPTIVLERFNELFSGKQNITLTEDIHNTFTEQGQKELTGFADDFRVFATCPANTPSKLSEAVLSRFTVIAAHDYTIDERTIVLNSLCRINNFEFDPQFIDLFPVLEQAFKSSQKIKPYSFSQMIKTVQLTSMINKESTDNSPEFNFGLSIFRIVGGLLGKKKRKILLDIIKKEVDPDFPLYFAAEDDKGTHSISNIKYSDNPQGLISNFTKLILSSSTAHEYNLKKAVAHTPLFCDILDVIHLGMTVHNPVILEGPPGQGKHTAIEYIANMLDVKVVYITISQSTKVDDLLGKLKIDRREDGIHVEMVKSKLVETISQESGIINKPIIVIENINNATPAVLNILLSIFNPEIQNILLSSGETMKKGIFYLIGIFNTQQSTVTRDKLPSALINSVIYYVVKNPTPLEIARVVETKFKEKDLSSQEITDFYTKFEKSREFLNNNRLPKIFTMNDISKYILFRNATSEVFSKSAEIMLMIFVYRFFQETTINDIREHLGLNDITFMPSFFYDPSKKYLLIRVADEKRFLKIPLILNTDPDKNPFVDEKVSKVNSLTTTQKYCLIFMACAVLSKRACVIQGGTASGKSFMIRLFAELVGAKLNVFQMNSDSSIGMLAGQSLLSEKLSPNDIEKFQYHLNKISLLPPIEKYLIDHYILPNQPDDWTPSKFAEMVKYAEKVASVSKSESAKTVLDSIKDIRELMSPVHRFENKESELIRAMREGEWVLIDGIESAPPEIAEKIASLCGENPELNLFECGPEYVYSKQNGIHENFQLFITFNPFSSKDNQSIDQSFLVKSVSFTLPEIDSDKERSAQILYGSMTNQDYNPNLSREVASRLGAMHQEAKEISKTKIDSFAGNLQFTGRTIKFIAEVLKYHQKYKLGEAIGVASPIAFAIKSFYLNSLNDKNYYDEFKKILLDKFEASQDELIEKLKLNQENVKQRNQFILISLRNIQLHLLKQSDPSYSFSSLINYCRKIQASDIAFIMKHFNDTLKLIHDKFIDGNKTIYERFGTLIVILNLLNEINSSFQKVFKVENSCLPIDDHELAKEKELDKPLSKLYLISNISKRYLIQKCSILMGPSVDENKNDPNRKALSLMKRLVTKKDKKVRLYKLIEHALKYPLTIDFMQNIFPYHKFIGTNQEGICLVFPIILSCIQQNVRFVVFVNDSQNDEYKIENEIKNIYDFKAEIFLNIPNNFDVSPETAIYFSASKCDFKMDEDIKNLNNDKRYKQGTYAFNVVMTNVLKTLSSSEGKAKHKIKLNEKIIGSFIGDFQAKVKENPKPQYDKIVRLSNFFFKEDQNTSENQQTSNSSPDEDANKTNIISYTWNIVASLDKKMIFAIEQIVNPLESHILHVAYELYKKCSFDSKEDVSYTNILDFSEWIATFDENLPILLKFASNIDIQNEKGRKRDDTLIKEIKHEMQFLKDSKSTPKGWDSEQFVRMLKAAEDKVLSSSSAEAKELHEVQEELDKIRYELENSTEFYDNEDLRQELLIEINSPYLKTLESVKLIVKRIRQLKTSIAKNSVRETENKIIWPNLNLPGVNQLSYPNYKNMKILLYYSQTFNNLDMLKNGKKPMKYVPRLKPFEMTKADKKQCLMDASIKSILDNFLRSNTCPSYLLENAFHELNASYLYQLFDISKDYFYHYSKMIKDINKYINRTELSDAELANTFELSNSFSENFEIIRPNIHYSDLIYLIVVKKITNKKEEFLPGPFLNKFLPDLKSLTHFQPLFLKSYQSFSQAALDIAEVTYKNFTKDRQFPGQSPDYVINDIKNFIDSITELGTKSLFEALVHILKFAKHSDKEKKDDNNYFKFDDLDFLDYKVFNLSEWFRNNVKEGYPSFAVWALQNSQLFHNIINIYRESKGKIISDNQKLPFWIHCLRVFSSESCIEFIPRNINKPISRKINKTVSDEIKAEIEKLFMESTKDLGTDWFNLLVPNVPSFFSNQFIHMIYLLLQNLSTDDNIEIHEDVIKQLGLVTQKIIELVFNGKIYHYFTTELPMKDDGTLAYFFKAPPGYIVHRINEDLQNKCQAFVNSAAVKSLTDFIDTNLETIKSHIVNVLNAINEDKNTYINLIINKQKLNFDQQVKRETRNYESKYANYNSYYAIFKKYNQNAQYLHDLRKSLMVINVKFKGNINDGKLHSTVPNQDIKELVKAYIKAKNQTELAQFVLYVISTTLDIEDQEFIQIMKDIYHLASKIHTHFLNDALTYWEPAKRDRVDDFIHKLQSNTHILANAFQAKIPSSGIPATTQKTNNALFTIRGDYTKFNSLIKNVIKEIDTLPKPESYMNIRPENIFMASYAVKNLKLNQELIDEKKESSFTITNRDSLQLPVVTLTKDGELKCSVKRIKHIFDPLIPSLFSKNIEFNVISLVDEPLSCSLDFPNSCKDYFDFDTNIGPRNPIKISTKIPLNKKDENEVVDYQGQIILRTNSSKPLKIDLRLIFQIVPMKIKLFCKYFKLGEMSSKFRICCNEFFSGQSVKIYVQSFYSTSHSFLNFNLEPENDNEADEPIVKYNPDKKYIKFEMNASEPKKLHCNLKIAMTQSLIANILFECMLVPFNFFFEVYDTRSKSFVSDSVTIFWAGNEVNHKLTFRIMSPCTPKKAYVKLFFDLPVEMNIITVKGLEGNHYRENINTNPNAKKRTFTLIEELTGNKSFSLLYKFTGKNIPGQYSTGNIINSNNQYEVRTAFAMKKKELEKGVPYSNRIKLSFISYPHIELDRQRKSINLEVPGINDIPIYAYNYYLSDFERFKNSTDISKFSGPDQPLIILTPFESLSQTINSTTIEYMTNSDDVIVNSNSSVTVSYLKLDTNGSVLENANTPFADKDGNLFSKPLNIQPAGSFASIVTTAFGLFDGASKLAAPVINQRKNFVRYTIIGELNSSTWFPAFSIYPHHRQEIPISPENIQTARDNLINELKLLLPTNTIKSFELKQLLSKDQINTDDLLNLISTDEKCISHKNFAILMLILMNKENVRKVNNLINAMPDDFLSRAHKIRKFIPKSSTDDNLLIIYSHNLIMQFEKVFKKRYLEIQTYGNSANITVSKEKINAISAIIYKEFFEVNKKQIFSTPNPHSPISQAITKYQTARSEINISPLPNEKYQHECYILMERNDPIPTSLDEAIPQTFWNLPQFPSDENSQQNDDDQNIENLPEIRIPDKPTIELLNQFFLACSQGASVLPIFMSRNTNSNRTALSYFLSLFQIYKILGNGRKNYSINSEAINSFNNSFNGCVNRLKDAGINFSFLNEKDAKIINSIQKSDNYSEFIKFPEPDKVVLPRIPWKTKAEYARDMVNDATTRIELENNLIATTDLNITQSSFNTNTIGDDDVVDNPATEPAYEEIDDEDKDLIIQKVNIKDADEYSSDDEFKDFDPSTIEDTNNDPNHIRIIKDIGKISKKNLRNGQAVDSLLSNLKEKDAIERVISRIHSMDRTKGFHFKDSNLENILNYQNLLNKSSDNLPIKEFISKASHLIGLLIGSAADDLQTRKGNENFTIPFSLISVNLLFDCSSYIPKVNKMFNMLLLTAFAYSLYYLGINYAISVVSDSKFRFILKAFEEPHSIEALQRVLDCCLISRFRTNYAETFKQFIENMKINDKNNNNDDGEDGDDKNPKENVQSQRALFLFTDGLDENLVLINAWKDTVLNDPSNSFGIIVTVPKSLDNENKREIENLWNKFNAETREARSTARLITIESSLNNVETTMALSRCFKEVLSRSESVQNNYKSKEYSKPVFDHYFGNLQNQEFLFLKSPIASEELKKGIYVKIEKLEPSKSGKIQIEKPDIFHYRGKTSKIVSCNVDSSIHDIYTSFIHSITFRLKNIYRSQLETIFKPNKASQTVLSSTGTDFDITALVLNLINPVPDPLIYLEEKGGLIRNYGVTVVIDASLSCFNFFTTVNSLKTVMNLLCALSSIEIPCIDIILSTDNEPIVLCSEVPSVHALGEKSAVWPAIFSHFSKEVPANCDLKAAIHAAYDLQRMRSSDHSSLLLVLTDGLYMLEEKKLIREQVLSATQCGINVIGIGIGVSCVGITDIFPQSVTSLNPEKIISAISCCYGDENPDPSESIRALITDLVSNREMNLFFNKYNEFDENPVFKELKDKLMKIPCAMDAFSDYYNEEQVGGDGFNDVTENPKGKDTEMYVANCLQGQKILILMLYNCDLNLEESPKVTPKYLSTSPDEGSDLCVKKAVEFFGIDIFVVEDYDSAISELMKRDSKGKCIYYACWVINGWKYPIVPYDKNPEHIVAFTECLKRFWENGGAVVMFAEGEPFFCQTNYFLEQITFPERTKSDGTTVPSMKTKLRLSGSHKGGNTLIGNEDVHLINNKSFNRSKNLFGQRSSLSHNLVKIFEGITISYANSDPESYKPFIPFMKDSEGGISALLYPADPEKHTGDIVIDCGYTKLFENMTSDGTFKYVQNIAGFTAQLENSISIYHIEPKDYRPNGFDFNPKEFYNCTFEFDPIPIELDDSAEDPLFIEAVKNMKSLFAVDFSGSIKNDVYYHHILEKLFHEFYKEGDLIMIWSNDAVEIDYETMEKIWTKQEGGGLTQPQEFLKLMVSSNRYADHLILITDGEINYTDIQNAAAYIREQGIKFQMIDAYVVGKIGDNNSVGTIFQKEDAPSNIYLYEPPNEEPTLLDGVSNKDIAIFKKIEIIDTRGKFYKHFSSIFKVIKSRMMGMPPDEKLKAKLLQMKERIEEDGKFEPDFERKMKALIEIADGAILNIFNNSIITAMVK